MHPFAPPRVGVGRYALLLRNGYRLALVHARGWAWLSCLLAIGALLALGPCRSAEARTGSYRPRGDGRRDRMQGRSRNLVESFENRNRCPATAWACCRAPRRSVAKVNTALRSRGYCDATINATVDGKPIADASALDAIDARPDNEPVSISVEVATGPRFASPTSRFGRRNRRCPAGIDRGSSA